MLRIVIDTDVLAAAVDSPAGASRQLLIELLDVRIQLVLSTALMLEYEVEIMRPERLARSRLMADGVREVLDDLGRC